MPIVSFDAMRQAYFRDAGAKYNDIVYWSKPADWMVQVTTPNASSYYVYINFNTKDGPVVLDVPPAAGAGLFGSMNDAWQAPQADIGPAGEDQGKGGRYLILPPGFKSGVPVRYFPVHFETYNGYSILRAIPASSSDADVAKALDLVKKIRVYPLTQAPNPPAQRYIDMSGKMFDGLAKFDDSFYDSLARMVNEEPVQTRDLAVMGQLRSLGIEKDKTFKPDAATRAIFKKTIAEAHDWFMKSVAVGETWWPDTRWILSGKGTGPKTEFTFQTADGLDVDERGMIFFLACAPPKKLGAATLYIGAYRDAKGEPLQGGKSYHLRVPPNVPAKQFWAVTVYDLETAGFIREAPRLSVDSYQNTHKNADGSVDIYFGPKAKVPAGKESNWVYTAPGKPWFTFFRFYGPEKAALDKTWIMGDIEEIK
jgi:hypothetical protein